MPDRSSPEGQLRKMIASKETSWKTDQLTEQTGTELCQRMLAIRMGSFYPLEREGGNRGSEDDRG